MIKKEACNGGIYEIENSNGRVSYKIFAENMDLLAFLQKNKDKVCKQMSSVFSMEQYRDYPNTRVRKLTMDEIKNT